ncbi:tryptophan 7-halogenase [Saccharophagus degradans]|uniref:tryptophan halogenase family protein n=1 Tax=Saccharophagus degradans TaxID=86304 RepID=UPI002477E0D3|nr:tryptophan halogenase family protein [Saccharophagus degradans]WGO97466.1 tryptophan 7-halogenase [Saccharophagus degradans]
MANKIKNIVIVGGGTAGWMTAAAISNSMGPKNYSITLVESAEIGTVGVGEATIPPIKSFNNALKINEDEFVRETKATFKLGIQFNDWRHLGHSYFHPFGNVGVDMDGVSFMHHWLRWRDEGGSLDAFAFNPEYTAAMQSKFMRVTQEPGPKRLPDFHYAYQFDAGLYAKYLSDYAQLRGVKCVEGKVVEVGQNPETGYIESLRLEDGVLIQGDFFVDCSGFRGLLIEQTLNAGYCDWSQWLPVDRAVACPSENSVGDIVPYTKATAKRAGWQWAIPLQHRTGNGYVYCSDFASDDEAAQELLSGLGENPLAEPRVLKFKTGIRKKSWIKNCVAIGLSSGFLEPLESTSIHLVQRAIFKLLAAFPKDHINEILIERFNREMEAEFIDVKDFLIAHYVTSERTDSPFWEHVRSMRIPDSLSDKFELFRSRGEVMTTSDSLFQEVSWFAVLHGQGVESSGYHPVADTISEDELRLRFTKIRSGVQKRVASMPKHTEYLRQSGLMKG